MAQNSRRPPIGYDQPTVDTNNMRRNLFSSALSRRGPTASSTTAASASTTSMRAATTDPDYNNLRQNRPHLPSSHSSYERRTQADRDRQILLLSPSGSLHLNTPPPLTPSTPLRHYSTHAEEMPDQSGYFPPSEDEQHSEERHLIEQYRKHRAQVEMVAEVRATFMNSLLSKVQSLSADAWMFGDEEEGMTGEGGRYGENGEFEPQ